MHGCKKSILTYILFYNVFIIEVIVSKVISKIELSELLRRSLINLLTYYFTLYTYNILMSYIQLKYLINIEKREIGIR